MFPLIRRLWVREVQKQQEGALSVLKGWLDINPHPHTHTQRAHTVLYEEVHLCVPHHDCVPLEQTLPTAVPLHRWPCQSPLLPAFAERPRALPIHRPLSAAELTSTAVAQISPLGVFAAALLAAFESSQPGSEAQREKSKTAQGRLGSQVKLNTRRGRRG